MHRGSGPDTAPPAGAAVDVSFVVAARDVEPFIAEAVGSALAQRGCRVEVLVVDDGSTDGTAGAVEEIARRDGRVRLFRRPAPRGAGAARNVALDRAAGDWVAVLDGDDALAPGRTRALLDLALSLGADAVADNVLRFGHRVAAEAPLLPVGPGPYAFTVGVADYLLGNRPLRRGRNLGYLKPMFRRRFLLDQGIRYDEALPIGEDFEICLRLLLAGGRYAVGSEPGYRYRVRPGSLSWRLGAGDVDAMAAAFDRLRPALDAAPGPGVAAAARSYRDALGRARSIAGIAAAAKGGDLGGALRAASRRPDTWDFVGPVALGAARRALARRRVAGPA